MMLGYTNVMIMYFTASTTTGKRVLDDERIEVISNITYISLQFKTTFVPPILIHLRPYVEGIQIGGMKVVPNYGQ